MSEQKEMSDKERKIRAITQLYYSRKDIQKAIFDFSKNREISPRYFEGFGKRPDSFQFMGDVFSMVKRGATSFHSSEEIWSNPLDIATGMSEGEYNEIRTGWDLLIDIDCDQGMDLSAYVAKAIIAALKRHGIKNFGLKFSGSKGFHIIVPWKAFPKDVHGASTKDLFPEFPKKILKFLEKEAKDIFEEITPSEVINKISDGAIKSGILCARCDAIAKEYKTILFECPSCQINTERDVKSDFNHENLKCSKCKNKIHTRVINKFYTCAKCGNSSKEGKMMKDRYSVSQEKLRFTEGMVKPDLFELMGLDLGLVSQRHLFRMPYSLHEKSTLASVVLEEADLDKFILNPNYKNRIADPLRVIVKEFYPISEENEAAELTIQALDWAQTSGLETKIEETKKASGKFADFKPIELKNFNENQYPPCVKKILEGMKDGKKRGLFVLINFFRSVGMDKDELEAKLYEWNDKNPEPLKKGYIHTQLVWTYKRKPLLPQNCRDFYRDLGVCNPDGTCEKIKNPVNYAVRKNFGANRTSSEQVAGSTEQVDTDKPKKKRVARPQKEVYTEGIEMVEKMGNVKRVTGNGLEDGMVVEQMSDKLREKLERKRKREAKKREKEEKKAAEPSDASIASRTP